MVREVWKWTGLVLLIILILFIFATLLEFGSLGLLKMKLGLKRQAIKSSLQYSEAKISLLWQLYEEYLTAGESHRNALVKRIRVEASRIGLDQVPQEIRNIIRR